MPQRVLPAATLTVVAIVLALSACHSRNSPYEVTVRPLDAGGSPLCFAVNRTIAPNAWLWEAGQDCSTRGSEIVPLKDVAVSQAGATTRFAFQIPTMLNTVRTIRLTFKGEGLECEETGAKQPTIARADLNIPDWTAVYRRQR